uniref:DUF2460 domain-containing protein n=1 Tax=viral metagenome TaxID=1070528 RepID=A0A6M3JAG0_9ZZZZ
MAENFTEQPNYVYADVVGYKTNIIPFTSGKEARYSKGSALHEFNLVYSMADDTQKNTIVDFFNARTGILDTFTWTNPTDNVTYTVRFKEDSLSVETYDYGIHRITFSFLEEI